MRLTPFATVLAPCLAAAMLGGCAWLPAQEGVSTSSIAPAKRRQWVERASIHDMRSPMPGLAFDDTPLAPEPADLRMSKRERKRRASIARASAPAAPKPSSVAAVAPTPAAPGRNPKQQAGAAAKTAPAAATAVTATPEPVAVATPAAKPSEPPISEDTPPLLSLAPEHMRDGVPTVATEIEGEDVDDVGLAAIAAPAAKAIANSPPDTDDDPQPRAVAVAVPVSPKPRESEPSVPDDGAEAAARPFTTHVREAAPPAPKTTKPPAVAKAATKPASAGLPPVVPEPEVEPGADALPPVVTEANPDAPSIREQCLTRIMSFYGSEEAPSAVADSEEKRALDKLCEKVLKRTSASR